MEQLSSLEQIEIPMPINSSYVGALHGHHHHHMNMTIHHDDHDHDHHPPSSHTHQIIIPSPTSPSHSPLLNNNINKTNEKQEQQKIQKKVTIKYRECQKNHAATMGGNATDGCGEFMPSGEEETLEALTCSACNCHRNFHRKDIEGEQHMIIPHALNSHFYPSTPNANFLSTRGKKVILGNGGNVIPFSRSVVPINNNMAYHVGGQSCSHVPSDQSDHEHHYDHNNHHGNGGVMVMRPHNNFANHVIKKRFRTKFSQEQKEKMLDFAEKVGWKIQRQEDAFVQQFCQEIGVKRRVLKVWMHNNKHHLAKKSNIVDTNNINNNNNNNNSSII